MITPKICIVFSAGAMGDFLLTLLLQQIRKEFCEIEIDSNGAVVNSPGNCFKFACEEFIKSGMNPNIFQNCTNLEIVNSHFYVKEMSSLFHGCEFYFIDETQYQDLVVDALIKKRALSEFSSLLDWFRAKHFSFSKIKKISDKHIIQTIIYDNTRNIKNWKDAGLKPIDISDIPNKEKCRNLIKNMLQLPIDEELFSKTFDKWADKNMYIIKHMEKH